METEGKIVCECCKKPKTRDKFTARAKKSMDKKICLYCRQNKHIKKDLKEKINNTQFQDRKIIQACLGIDCSAKFETTISGTRFCQKCRGGNKDNKFQPGSVSAMLNNTWSF